MTFQVKTAIEKGWQAGLKTFQSLTINGWGQIVSHWAFTGTTNLFYLAELNGWGGYSANVATAGNRYSVVMAGSSLTQVGVHLPGFAPIDYEFTFRGTLGGGVPTLSGMHDAYPSYTVWGGGELLHYRHETGGLGALRNPMEIQVGN